jgi:uncharacterized protein
MKTIQRTGFLMVGLMLSTLFSCSKNEEVGTDKALVAEQVEQPNTLNMLCSFVDDVWSPTAVLSNSIGTATETFFMNSQNSKIAAIWGKSPVPLTFVKDPNSPNSTFNAISYSEGKIYYGEALYKAAKAKNANNIVNVMILAHEYTHQLQFTLKIPSKQENTVRSFELEADGMAGYYLRKPTGFNAGSFALIASAYEFASTGGDNNVNDPSHHGTPAQRRSAVRLGWLLAVSNLNPISFDTAFFKAYNSVLDGSARQLQSIEGLSKSENDYVVSHLDEIRRIATGQMSDEEYLNLQ